jgi:hypothetical protein
MNARPSQTFKPDIKAALVQLAAVFLALVVFLDQILQGRRRFVPVMLVLAAVLLIRQLRSEVVVGDSGVRVRRKTFAWETISEVKVLPSRRLRGPLMMVVAGVLPKIFAGRIGLKVQARNGGSAKWVQLPRVSDREGLLSAIRQRLVSVTVSK